MSEEVINDELVRCRPCGYVMKKSELDKVGVCPACGLPHTVFEPYREKVSANRLFILGLDIHPIVIHLSDICSYDSGVDDSSSYVSEFYPADSASCYRFLNLRFPSDINWSIYFRDC